MLFAVSDAVGLNRSIAISVALSCLVLADVASADGASPDVEFADGQTWGFEIGLGGGWGGQSAYTRRLGGFGYERVDTRYFRFSAAIEKIVLPYLSVLLQTNLLDGEGWERDSGIGPDDRFTWTNWTLDAHLRAFIPFKRLFRAYIQVGVGPTFVSSRLHPRNNQEDSQDTYRELKVSYNVAGLAGFEVLPGDHIGLYLQGGYFYTPAPENLLGDRHSGGGGLILAGLSGHFGRRR
jgi:hypothetical protein